jgi:t-SNARE complex subunit (syntaxin)
LALEKSVNELFELFQELAQLVQMQGEMLDNIEQNLTEANDYMEKAETNLQTAQTIHEQNRSKMCWIIALLIIVGIIVVLWALGVF